MDPNVIKKHFEIDSRKIVMNDVIKGLRKWKILQCDFPNFIITMTHLKSNKEYTFRFICDNYPISVEMINSNTLEALPQAECPQGSYFLYPHPITQKPFICLPRLREYHTHSSHINETQWIIGEENRLTKVVDSVYTTLQNAIS